MNNSTAEIDNIEFRYTTENNLEEEWTESHSKVTTYDSILDSDMNIYKMPLYHFQFLFCLCKSRNLKAEPFLKKYFRLEATISIVSLIGSVAIGVWGVTFFSLQDDDTINTDRELIALLSGTSGLVFFGFKFYALIKSLQILKRRSFDPLIGCAATISFASHFILALLTILLIFLSYTQGVFDIEDGRKGHRWFEEDLGFFLLGLCFPLFFLLLIVVSQITVGWRSGDAVKQYMNEYIGSERMVSDKKKRRDKELRKQGLLPKEDGS